MKSVLALTLLLFTTGYSAAVAWPNCNVAGYSNPSSCCCATNTISGPNGKYIVWTCSCAVPFPLVNPFDNMPSLPPVPTNQTVIQFTNAYMVRTWLVGDRGWVDPEGNPILTMFSYNCTNFLVRTTGGIRRVWAAAEPIGPWFPETYSVTGWVSASATERILCRQDTTFGSPYLGYISTPTNMLTIHYDQHGTAFETNWCRLTLTTVGGVMDTVTATLIRQSARTGPIPVPASGVGRFFRFE